MVIDRMICVPNSFPVSFNRGMGIVSMCMGTGMGAAAVFEYEGAH